MRMRRVGVEPDLLAYTTMIRCCCRGREIERGLNLLDEMHQDDIRPSVWTYNDLLRGVSVTPQWHHSSALLTDEILDMMEADEIQANLVTFNSLIRACAAVGDVVNARAYFEPVSYTHLTLPTT